MAGAAGGVAPAGARTIGSELRQVLNSGLNLRQDTKYPRQVAYAFQVSVELKPWQVIVRQTLRLGAPDTGEACAATARGLPPMPPVPPEAPNKGAGKKAAKGPGGAPSSAAKGMTGRRADGGGSPQPRGNPKTGSTRPATRRSRWLQPRAQRPATMRSTRLLAWSF